VTEPLRVLIVEDRPSDAELMALRLEDEGFDPVWERVETEEEYLAALAIGPDVILSDWRLPLFSGLRALGLLREERLDIPFVIVSGSIGEEAAVDAVHGGAEDYVLKDRLARLGPAVRRARERKRMRDERRIADAQQRLAATVFESSTEGVTITDREGTILTVNHAFEEITGYRAEDVIGLNARVLQSGRHDETFYRDLWAMLLATGRWRGELWNRTKDGRIYPEWMTISAVIGANGETTNYVGVFSDIGDIKKAQQDLIFLAHHDALTGLPNRTLFLDRLEQAVRRAETLSEGVAVLSLDLDGFGAINDAHGHPVGDALLRATAVRLGDELGSRGSLGRLGADEFVMVLEDARGAPHVAGAARLLQECLAMPFSVEGHEIVITGTVGISLYPDDSTDPSTLLRHAETAMRQSRAEGRNSIRFFESALTAGIEERLHLSRDLRGATARGELVVHYQPQLRLDDGSLVGAEALVRWQHPGRGLISPGVFIPLAEDIGVIDEIGLWVMNEACHQVAAWDAAGLHLQRMAVNLSAHQLGDADLAGLVSAALDAANIAPERLELEVTESMVMLHVERSAATLAAVTALGVAVAMDDFGTGHSSLAQLKHLPLRRLKIDISFIRDIGVNATGEAIIRATVVLAKSLDLETVGEGIEHEDQARFLRRVGCDIAQGFFFGRPVPAAEFLATFRAKAGAT
jgi:diguanylate cyclase (GGDEF)-like protein/PAS domain S-box-containing protein